MAGPFVKLPRDLSLVGLIDRLNLQFQRQFAQSSGSSTVSPTVGEILTSPLWFDPDNTFDIGLYIDGTGASDLRPKSIYAGTKMRAPLFQADTQVTAPTGTFTSVAGTLTTASQPNVTTMANLTTIGTLVAGAVPLSLVTAGTSPAGTFIFPTLAATTRLTSALIGTTTATNVVFDRNSVTQLTLGSLLATFAGDLAVGSGTVATAGRVRLANNSTGIQFR